MKCAWCGSKADESTMIRSYEEGLLCEPCFKKVCCHNCGGEQLKSKICPECWAERVERYYEQHMEEALR